MNTLRHDPLSGRWIAISSDRINRPNFSPIVSKDLSEEAPCPFCPGNEEATPPALETYHEDGRWLVRVIPNRFPAFSGQDSFVLQHHGPVFIDAPATGIHEVLILSPSHNTTWADFSTQQSDLVMFAIKDRIKAHQSTPGLRYSQAIVNAGREAGASLHHPHGQLMGIPIIPKELIEEQGNFARFSGDCLLCVAAAVEESAKERLVHAGEHAITVAPYWSGSPYELLIVPRHHEAHLSNSSKEELSAIGKEIRDGLKALKSHMGDIAYNVVFHSAPYRSTTLFHWHIHILPKLTTLAGFELGTGLYINIVTPEEAAENLRRFIVDEQPTNSEKAAS
ncbi:MAG: DUF4921 family protein [Firmicutes bacterium]|nr:DUF4921 family protein [Bacillota bacterium]